MSISGTQSANADVLQEVKEGRTKSVVLLESREAARNLIEGDRHVTYH